MTVTDGYHNTNPNSNRYNLLCSLLRAGKRATGPHNELTPYGLSSATPGGVIASEPDSDQFSMRVVAVSISMLSDKAAAADMSINLHSVVCETVVLGINFCLRDAEFLSSRRKRPA
ncbi:hypothetical protein L917_09965 [Phytophthora nicotianae]|uniref:Uncharacterized protein n=1 Tax=Phytophthora nicotianae TaxID=4792 RepID=W2L248_PHYNI|nr:hypothetical protein L917_09965 [Phytophthora nicotianae]